MEQVKDRLVAIAPCYDRQGGNSTLIYTHSGEIIPDQRTVKWNLRRLARLYSVDLQAVRQNYGAYLGCRQGVPLPFSTALVLVPLKLRLPVGKNDGCYGYINVLAVESFQPDADCRGRCIIKLAGGHSLTCLYTFRTVQKKMGLGKIALDCYQRSRELPEYSSLLPVWLSASGWKLLESLIKAIIQETTNSSLSE
ncbi:MAG TPA: hypothetical protein GX693_08035 [Firmicutes bacterium]|nr:hypothetical protein [Bacillota bacterium]